MTPAALRLHDRAARRHRATSACSTRMFCATARPARAPATAGPAAPRPASRPFYSSTTRRRPCSTRRTTARRRDAQVRFPQLSTSDDSRWAATERRRRLQLPRRTAGYSADPAHNRWYASRPGSGLALRHVSAQRLDRHGGRQRPLNVGGENLFSIWTQSLGNARVFGGGRMAAYTPLTAGSAPSRRSSTSPRSRRCTPARRSISTCSIRATRAAQREPAGAEPGRGQSTTTRLHLDRDPGGASTGLVQRAPDGSGNGAAQSNNRDNHDHDHVAGHYGVDGLIPPGDYHGDGMAGG